MNSSQCLFVGCNYEKEVKIEAETLHNIADFEHQYFLRKYLLTSCLKI